MFDAHDDDVHLPEEWNPTPAQFAAYRNREIELAKANCELLAERDGMHAVRASNTLHTKHEIRDFSMAGKFRVPAEWERASKNPNRVAMGSFMLGFQAMLEERAAR